MAMHAIGVLMAGTTSSSLQSLPDQVDKVCFRAQHLGMKTHSLDSGANMKGPRAKPRVSDMRPNSSGCHQMWWTLNGLHVKDDDY